MRSTRSPYSISCGALLLLALILPAPAGGESGGMESPFAFGVGARALSLGGAYVAIAEGPTALAWNPGGIGTGQRKEATFFYTSPFVEGNRLTFIGYVHPFLDFGTIGVGNQRYGLSDIQKYDEGRAALGSFSNVQNEWILSYALPPYGPLHLGASAKVETHALDDHSATGIGADLGLIVRSEDPPTQRLSRRNFSFGLAVRNLLEPKLSLSSGEDRLPMLLRAGVAYRIPFRGGGGEILLLASLDQGKESGGRGRIGTEVAVGGGLSLRMGMGGEEWSSGLGLETGFGRLDYSYGSRELGTAHRLGITFSFGSSLSSLREERRLDEERLLAERTSTELQKKERGQFDASMAQGNAHFQQGEYAEAESWYERALLWDPENGEALARLDEARVERHLSAGDEHRTGGNLLDAMAEYRAALAVEPDEPRAEERLALVTEALQRSEARSAEVNTHLTRGVEYLALSDLLKAKDEFGKALQIEPENADAKRYGARADSLIDLRVDQLAREARWQKERGDEEGAITRLRDALTLRPERNDLSREVARLEASLRSGEPAAADREEPPAKPQRREATAEEIREAEQMYRSGLDVFKEDRWTEAIRYFEFVYGLVPDFENVETYLKQAYLFLGMDHYTAGELAAAIETWERILRIDPGDEKALSYLRKARVEIQKTQEISGEDG